MTVADSACSRKLLTRSEAMTAREWSVVSCVSVAERRVFSSKSSPSSARRLIKRILFSTDASGSSSEVIAAMSSATTFFCVSDERRWDSRALMPPRMYWVP